MLAPKLLIDTHELDLFSCGKPVLDDWLKKRARVNHVSGASRTYVVAEGNRVIGYYCISSGAMNHGDAPGSIRRNMPDPVPMAIIGRLAIDEAFQGRGIGVALLRDAVLRIGEAAQIMGVRGVLVQALDEEAKSFYEKFGFTASATMPMILAMSLKRPN